MKKVIKKMLCLIMAVLMVAGFFPVIADAEEISAKGVASATLSVSTAKVGVGGNAKVTISLSEGSNVAMAQFAVKYDSSIFKFVSASSEEVMGDVTTNSYEDGTVYFGWDDPTPVTAGGTILELVFRVPDNAELGEYPVEIDTEEEFVFADADSNNLDMKIENGKIVIIDGIYGDLNGDEKINIKDTYLARLIAAKLITPTEKQSIFGDVDLDHKITAIDANLLRKYAVKLIEKLPVRNEEPEDEKPTTGSVYWLNFKPESDEVLKEIAAMYTAETGVEVKIKTAASGTYNKTLTKEMEKDDAPTIFVVSKFGAPIWGDYCLDLKGSPIAEELITDDFNVYYEDKLVSIAYCYECYGIIVNNVLLKAAGHDVSEITNFETLKAVAEDITANKDTLGFSAFTSAGMDGSSSWRFTGHLINLEYVYEYRDNPEAWGNGTYGPATLTGNYMSNYKALYDLMVENATVDRKELANGGFDANAEFAKGKAAFYCNGSWEYSSFVGRGMNHDDLYMIPYYCGVEGEEKAALNCGTENYWAINGTASEEDIQATMDFLVWLVTDAEASEKAVATFGVMPYKSAAESTNAFLAQANAYLADGCYNFDWVTNFQPNVDDYRATAVAAINAYNADPSDANWATVVTAFIDGWAEQYKNVYD